MVASWGQGRVETYTLREEIAGALALKHPLSSVYEKFFADRRITVAYDAFRKNIQKLRAEGHLDSPSAPLAPSRLTSASPAGPIVGPAAPHGASSPKKHTRLQVPADQAGSPAMPVFPPDFSREGFAHKSDGATDNFLDSVYGITPSTPDKESVND